MLTLTQESLINLHYDYDVQGVCEEGEELLHRDLDLLQVLYLRLAPPSSALSAKWGHCLLL